MVTKVLIEWLLGGYFLAQWCSGLWMWPSSAVSEIKGIFRPCSNLAGRKKFKLLGKVIAQISLQMDD